MLMKHWLRNFRDRLRDLAGNASGVAMVELAVATPVFMAVTLSGIELTNFAIAKMRISQLALHVADNGSRIGMKTMLTGDPQISEAQINDVLTGANLQSRSLALLTNGRVIMSSLEPDAAHSGKYMIHWQRCKGLKNANSSYGVQGTNNMTNMGPAGRQVVAPSGSGVIYVEIFYDYHPLVSGRLVSGTTIHEVAAMTVRDRRDFSGNGGTGVYNNEGVTAANCTTYSAT
jgi:hypothetical protein